MFLTESSPCGFFFIFPRFSLSQQNMMCLVLSKDVLSTQISWSCSSSSLRQACHGWPSCCFWESHWVFGFVPCCWTTFTIEIDPNSGSAETASFASPAILVRRDIVSSDGHLRCGCSLFRKVCSASCVVFEMVFSKHDSSVAFWHLHCQL